MSFCFLIPVLAFLWTSAYAGEWRFPLENSKVNYHHKKICINVKGVENCINKDSEPGDAQELAKMFSVVHTYESGDGDSGHKLKDDDAEAASVQAPEVAADSDSVVAEFPADPAVAPPDAGADAAFVDNSPADAVYPAVLAGQEEAVLAPEAAPALPDSDIVVNLPTNPVPAHRRRKQ